MGCPGLHQSLKNTHAAGVSATIEARNAVPAESSIIKHHEALLNATPLHVSSYE